jgi:hypothetical protein
VDSLPIAILAVVFLFDAILVIYGCFRMRPWIMTERWSEALFREALDAWNREIDSRAIEMTPPFKPKGEPPCKVNRSN